LKSFSEFLKLFSGFLKIIIKKIGCEVTVVPIHNRKLSDKLLFGLGVGLPFSNLSAYHSFFSELIRQKLMQKLVRSWEYVRNSGNVKLYVIERDREFTHVENMS